MKSILDFVYSSQLVFRDGVHSADVSDLMRRIVKENLLKFDGTLSFPNVLPIPFPINFP